MEKIININYLGSVIPIEESAQAKFTKYEKALRQYLQKEADADEVYRDLQTRMYEIMMTKLQSKDFISNHDINEIMNVIGKPEDLYEAESLTETYGEPSGTNKTPHEPKHQQEAQPKKFRRNLNDRMISGLCGGIANYLGMDSAGVRLLFVTLTLINPPLGLVLYLLGYIIPAAHLPLNISHKFFRNPYDRVLGGVCGGMGVFFNKESWIFRLMFILPVLFSILSKNHLNGWLGGSLLGSFVLTYIILWIITPVVRTPNDYKLLKGETINLSNYNSSEMQNYQIPNNNSGFNTIVRVIAFIVAVFCLMIFVPVSFGVVSVGVYASKLAGIVLGTPFMKMLYWISLLLFFALPLVALIVWIIRRLAGTKRNPRLKSIFLALWAVGLVATMLLGANLTKEMNTFGKSKSVMPLHITSDTLLVKAMGEEGDESSEVIFSANSLNDLIQEDAHDVKIGAVRVHKQSTADSNFSILINKYSLGKNADDSKQKAEAINFAPYFDNQHTLYIPTELVFEKGKPYRGQNVDVVINVPDSKYVKVSPSLKSLQQIQINGPLSFKKGVVVYSSDDDDDITDITISGKPGDTVHIKSAIDEASKQETLDDLNEELEASKNSLKAMQQSQNDEMKDLERQIDRLQKDIEKAKKK